MDSEKILLELDAIADMSPEQVNQLTDMINYAYVGRKLDTEFVESNIAAYSALNSKAILVLISNLISKETGQKAIEIVAFIRASGKAVAGVNLFDVLGLVQPRDMAEVEAMKKDLAAWEQAYAEIGSVDLSHYDLETDEGFNAAIEAVVARNEMIAQRALQLKKEKEQAEIERAAQEAYVSEQDEIRKGILTGAVNEVVTAILNRYATLYADLFVNPAMGVITSRGILGAAKDYSVRVTHTLSAAISISIFSILSKFLGDAFRVPEAANFDMLPVNTDGTVRNDLYNTDGTCNYTYLPRLQALLVSGIYRSVSYKGNAYIEHGGFAKARTYMEFASGIRTSLTCDISKIINRVFRDEKDLMACIPRLNVLKDSLIRLYTTTIIAEEVVPNKVIRMRVSCLGAENKLQEVRKVLLESGTVGLGTEVASAEVLNNTVVNGVLKLTISLNKEAFTQETLFAHEALERVYASGNKVDMGSIVVGRKLSGELMAINLASPGSVVLSIQAGGRSGKGVLTLSILATMIGSGCPFIYLDNKPDMAALLWQLERQYGIRILSIDVTGKSVEYIPAVGGGTKEVRPVRCGSAYNIPTGLSSDIFWSAFAYAKLATLYTIAMHCKGTGKIPELDAAPLFFAVFDEASSVSKALSKNYVELVKKLKTDKTNAAALKLKGFLEALSPGLGAIFSNYPDRGLKILLLSQSWNTETWKDPAADGKTPQMFYPLMYGASMRILGVDNTGGQQNALGGATVPGKNLISRETMGHFAYVPKNRAYEDDVLDVFKSYLVLNDNDFDTSGNGKHGKYVGGMLTSLKGKDTVIAATLEKIAPGGVPDMRVGFSGLLSYIGAQSGVPVAERLGLGYKIMDAVAALVGITGQGGRYANLEDWLYDCTPETFWSYAELKNMVDTGTKVTDCGGEKESVQTLSFDDVAPENVIPAVDPISMTVAPEIKASEQGLLDTVLSDVGESETVADLLVTGGAVDSIDALGVDVDEQSVTMSDVSQRPVEQETPVKPPVQQKPYMYIDGVPFVADENGVLHFATGRYAPPQNVQPNVYQGQSYASAPIVDTAGKLPYTEGPTGERVLTEADGLAYAQPVQGAEVRFNGKLKPITANMSMKNLETAMTQRWYVLMRAAGQMVGGVGLVARISVMEHLLLVNGIPLYAAESILEDTGLTIKDVVDFRELLKYFKHLKQLDIDFPTRLAFGAAYSSPAIPFTQSKSLQVINFTGSDGKVIAFTRQHAAQKLAIPEDRLNSRFNTWTAFAAQVNKGQTSSFCKPGTRLLFADYTKRLAVGAFGPGSTWSRKRRALGAVGMILCAAGTVVTGGIQAARSVRARYK